MPPAGASAMHITDRPSVPARSAIGQRGPTGARCITDPTPQLRGGRPIAFLTRAYQPPVLIPPAIPPPATTPAVRPCSCVPQRSQSLRPVIEV